MQHAHSSHVGATRLCGINVDHVRLAVFVLMCVFANLVNTARLADVVSNGRRW
ncbi:hypothetical protein [Rhodanobacter sp. MP1X3]|jgi:D-xylose transport system permease protein|uniref:hypothetical protein n=1 Tax=Rhodanobacter sp. MP1X3 TaxID=2723086 RepID=UPI001607B276|nr:hypothetical protein [Rhodanobacter sp. MP1X3]MBB6242497.1 ABC-type xylose transport system permease subunit [Rhodanobacter sp. MP1X3]